MPDTHTLAEHPSQGQLAIYDAIVMVIALHNENTRSPLVTTFSLKYTINFSGVGNLAMRRGWPVP